MISKVDGTDSVASPTWPAYGRPHTPDATQPSFEQLLQSMQATGATSTPSTGLIDLQAAPANGAVTGAHHRHHHHHKAGAPAAAPVTSATATGDDSTSTPSSSTVVPLV